MEFERDSVVQWVMGLREMPQFPQIVIGPRQVGKTTAMRQAADRLDWPRVVASADESLPPGAEWVESQWRLARVKEAACQGPVLLVLDEIQKVAGWSEVVKRLWDEEQARKGRIRVVLLGSSALQLHQGMTESLAGRYFLHRCTHWMWPECEKAFGWSLEDWLVFGGYPRTRDVSARSVSNRRRHKAPISKRLNICPLTSGLHVITLRTLNRSLNWI